MKSNDMVEVRDLYCERDDRRIIEGVGFTVQPGAYAVVTGPNGAGKTTLLRCLDRIIDDWSGSIRLDGVALRSVPRRILARRVAYVQQTTAVMPFSAIQYVRLARYPFLDRFAPFSNEDEQIVAEAMGTMRVLDLAHRSLDSLSGGERQRVFLAAALAQQPELLLLDEPTAMLDYSQRDIIAELLRSLHENRGTTIIEVTHDLNHAALYGTQVLVMSKGKIVYDGPAREVTQPARLRDIYGMDIELVRHPRTDVMMVVPRNR